jgi:hypothetical protein
LAGRLPRNPADAECEIEENYIATDKNHLSTLVSGFIARINAPTQPLKVISKETRQ